MTAELKCFCGSDRFDRNDSESPISGESGDCDFISLRCCECNKLYSIVDEVVLLHKGMLSYPLGEVGDFSSTEGWALASSNYEERCFDCNPSMEWVRE